MNRTPLPSPSPQTPRPAPTLAVDPSNQWLFSSEQILHCPSFRDGMTHSQIEEKRQRGCEFIRNLGRELHLYGFFFSFHNLGKNDSQPSQKLTVRSGRLPRWSCITRGSFRCIHLRSTARLWVFFSGSNFLLSWRKYQKNVVAHPMLAYQEVAATCLFLGSKVEEVRVPLRDCVMVTLYERSNRQKKFHETTEVFFKILFYLFSLVLFTKRLPCSGIQGPSQENSGARDDSPAHALFRPCRWAPLWLNP